MTPQERQAALDNISEEDLEKIKVAQASTGGSLEVDEEWLLMTEFAMTFGWEAYLHVKNDLIPIQEMLTLIEASRKIKSMHLYQDSQASFIGAVSAQSKKPADTFKKLTKNIVKQTRVKS